MDAVILTPVRMLGDGLAQCLNCRPEIMVAAVVTDLSALRKTLASVHADVALIDVTQDMDFEEIRVIAAEWPNLPLVALGLPEQRREVIRRGRAAFSGFTARDGTGDELCDAIVNAVASRLTKPAETSPGLLRRLFAWMRHPLTRL